MSFKNIVFASVMICYGISLISCAGSGPDMTPEERFSADTLYNNRLHVWRTSVDSMCQLQKDSLYDLAVDSIRTERMEEIEMLLRTN